MAKHLVPCKPLVTFPGCKPVISLSARYCNILIQNKGINILYENSLAYLFHLLKSVSAKGIWK